MTSFLGVSIGVASPHIRNLFYKAVSSLYCLQVLDLAGQVPDSAVGQEVVNLRMGLDSAEGQDKIQVNEKN